MVTRACASEAWKTRKKRAPPHRGALLLDYIFRPGLEAEGRPEGHVQVVVGAIIEVHQVAGLGAQAKDVADKKFQARARIKYTVGVAVQDVSKLVGETSG